MAAPLPQPAPQPGPQPGSIAFLHHFVQECTAPGKVSVLKNQNPAVPSISEPELINAQRVTVMFRCVLPQLNESRHALLSVRPEIDAVQRDNMVNVAFSINNRINGTCGRITGFRPVWAAGHTPPDAEVDTFNKALKVMGERMNGIMEVEAGPLKCDHCDETDRDKLRRHFTMDQGIGFLCGRCLVEFYEIDPFNWRS